MFKPKINEDLCIGCGACEALCSNVFKLENGKAKVVDEDCKGCDCQEAIESCPANAISKKE